jgi:hypothetical protein
LGLDKFGDLRTVVQGLADISDTLGQCVLINVVALPKRVQQFAPRNDTLSIFDEI